MKFNEEINVSKSLLGPASIARNHFEPNTVFDGAVAEKILVAYECTSRRAAALARYAMRDGGLENIRRAQWEEAVALTLEATLRCFPRSADGDAQIGDEALQLADLPIFDSCK